jgi:hypothetical protein
MMSERTTSPGTTKREFLQKASYVVPAVLTLAAAPSFASAGSNSKKAKKPKGPYKHHHKNKRK